MLTYTTFDTFSKCQRILQFEIISSHLFPDKDRTGTCLARMFQLSGTFQDVIPNPDPFDSAGVTWILTPKIPIVTLPARMTTITSLADLSI